MFIILHIVILFLNAGESISLDLIDIFWKKLDYKPMKVVGNDDIEEPVVRIDDVLEKIKENYNEETEAGKIIYMNKLSEIYEPRATDIEEPVVQKNTRGRPSLKKQQKKKANRPSGIPSCFNDLDLNQEPERHSYSFDFDLNEEPQSYDPFLMRGIPYIFRDYIDGIQNVIGDGNCGFRAVAVCLGLNEDKWLSIRHDLLEELHNDYSLYHGAFTSGFNELHESLCWNTSPAYEPHYMIMPLTGYLIASKFRVIVHCLSHEQSMTCFPLRKGPEECQPHRTITLVNVNGNHYMSVFLKENYPMPPTTPYWNAHRNSSASAWKAMYWSRFELYNQLTSRSFVPPWINIDD